MGTMLVTAVTIVLDIVVHLLRYYFFVLDRLAEESLVFMGVLVLVLVLVRRW